MVAAGAAVGAGDSVARPVRNEPSIDVLVNAAANFADQSVMKGSGDLVAVGGKALVYGMIGYVAGDLAPQIIGNVFPQVSAGFRESWGIPYMIGNIQAGITLGHRELAEVSIAGWASAYPIFKDYVGPKVLAPIFENTIGKLGACLNTPGK
ncbi:hypothetical protein HYY72_00220 [Candidatus Woesearchaeota archaeon]|nr:hypothetical protein [Candidatus Woesearchaeota archaeon]